MAEKKGFFAALGQRLRGGQTTPFDDEHGDPENFGIGASPFSAAVCGDHLDRLESSAQFFSGHLKQE